MTQISSKTCLRCKQTKLQDSFGWSGYVKKDGTKSKCSYCRDCQNELRVERKHNINYQEYLQMLKSQGNCCANKGCKSNKPGAPGRKRFYIDHDHKTGKVRGLLCHSCNLALGHVQDNVEKLKGLIEYLHENEKINPTMQI